MPIYEYLCHACQHQFEEVQKVSDPEVCICPNCHKNEVVRLVSAAGFQLKGTGWYATDFKDKGKQKTSTDAAASESTPKTTERKGETK